MTELRDQIAEALYEEWRQRHPGELTWETDADWRREPYYRQADAVLTAVQAHQQQHDQQVRAEVAEQIAQALIDQAARASRRTGSESQGREHYLNGRLSALQEAIDTARQHADGGSDDN